MRAIVISQAGGPESLALKEVPEPEPGGAEVRVRVHAAALNRADLLQRRGLYPPPPGVDPGIPGLEFAGEVDRLGPRAGLRTPGERVMGLVGGAAYADYVVLHERETIRIPDGMGFADAAAIPESFLTAYRALFLEGGLQPGQWCVVRAATSGVGIAAVQLVSALGARSVGTSRFAERLQRLTGLGLTVAHEEGAGELAATVADATAGRGATVGLDLLGGGYLAENLSVLADEGTLVVVGLLGGMKDELDFARLLMRRLTIRAMTMRSQPAEVRMRLARLAEERLLPLLEDGRLRPVVDTVMPLDSAADAHRRMESGDHFGKIVLEMVPG